MFEFNHPVERVEDVAAILEAAEHIDERTAAVVWLMARAGLRIGEAVALHRSDIDATAGTLTVRRSMNRRGDLVAPKGRKRADQGRTIPMPADLTERLRRHLAASVASIDGLVFTALRGGPLSYTNWRSRVWTPIVERAGVDANPHDLRHTCATRLFTVDRWNPAEVQRFLGHRDPRITLAIYTHVTSDDLPTPSALTSSG